MLTNQVDRASCVLCYRSPAGLPRPVRRHGSGQPGGSVCPRLPGFPHRERDGEGKGESERESQREPERAREPERVSQRTRKGANERASQAVMDGQTDGNTDGQMHRLSQRQTGTGRDRREQTETGRDRRRSTQTGGDRHRQTQPYTDRGTNLLYTSAFAQGFVGKLQAEVRLTAPDEICGHAQTERQVQSQRQSLSQLSGM